MVKDLKAKSNGNLNFKNSVFNNNYVSSLLSALCI